MSYIGNPLSTSAFLTESFSGTGSQTAFTLSAAPANTASILVAISGVLQDPTTYSLVGTTLNFSGAPPSATGNISVRYLGIPAAGVVNTAYRTVTEYTATANQTTFSPPSYTVGFINVFRNGVLLGSADYTANNGTSVVLASGATAGDLISIESFYVASFVNAIQAVPGAVNDNYLAAGAVTTIKVANANITLPKLSATGTASSSTFLRGDDSWATLASLGVDQTWQNVSGSRTSGTTYTNSTGKPIAVSVGTTFAANARVGATVNSIQVGSIGVATSGGDVSNIFIVPAGGTYVVTVTNASVGFWSELR